MGGGMAPRDIIADYPVTSHTSKLVIQAPIGLTQGYLVKLFSLIPGMEYCDLNETTGQFLLYKPYFCLYIECRFTDLDLRNSKCQHLEIF